MKLRYIVLGLLIGCILWGAYDGMEWYRAHLFLP